MKTDKADGLSKIVIEMITTTSNEIVTNITNLVNRVVYDGKIPDDWNLSNIVKCFYGNENIVDHVIYCKFKLFIGLGKMLNNFWMVLSVIRWIFITCSSDLQLESEQLIQFSYFIKCTKKYLTRKHNIYFAFVDLAKAFDHSS